MRPTPSPLPAVPAVTPTRAPYQTPKVQPLGAWNAVTLAQSIPVSLGSVFGNPVYGQNH